MPALGLDIGYSNLKLAYGAAGEDPAVLLLPSGAAPASLRLGALGKSSAAAGVAVSVNGTSYCAAVPHDRFDDWVRTLHDDYTESEQYTALFHGALKLTGADVIDHLVVGLPGRDAVNRKRCEKLAAKLTGTHLVAQGRQVQVQNVRVVPQPVGSFMACYYQAEPHEIPLLEQGQVLVVDPGFFSVDWSLISRGELVHSATGSSLHAVSSLLEEASKRNGNPRVEVLENALREGSDTVVCAGQVRELRDILATATATVAPKAMAELRRALRKIGDVDLIVLTGGGAALYEAAARESFPETRVMVLKDPATANALGFWMLACSSAGA